MRNQFRYDWLGTFPTDPPKASPLPWTVRSSRVMHGPRAGDIEWVILDAGGRCVATVYRETDARFICQVGIEAGNDDMRSDTDQLNPVVCRHGTYFLCDTHRQAVGLADYLGAPGVVSLDKDACKRAGDEFLKSARLKSTATRR